MRWNALKPTYFAYSGTPVYTSTDIGAFLIDTTKVDIGYLASELHASYITDQIESVQSGISVHTIRREDLLNVRILLPTLEEQRAKVKGIAEALAEAKKKELDDLYTIHGLKQEKYDQDSYLRHTLAGSTSNLASSIAKVKSIITDKVLPISPEILQQKMDGKNTRTLGEYLDTIERDIAKIKDSVSQQLKTEVRVASAPKSPIDIADFVKSYVREMVDNKANTYAIRLNVDEEVFSDDRTNEVKVMVLANENLLRDMFNNLIDNAVVHAFENHSKSRIEIFLTSDNQLQECRF
jgi:type I restriction enzyme M protein